MPVWTHPPWVLFKLNYPANLNTQAAWRISKFIGGSSAIVDVDFIFGALKQGINSSKGEGGKFSKTRHLGDIDVQRPGLKG